MTVTDVMLTTLAWAGSLYALWGALGMVRTVRTVPVLADSAAPPPMRWPRVSVIVPARDEAAEIEEAVRSRLADDYPALELILVDDRSGDSTGEIMDRLALADARVRVVHVKELPPCWLGKLHALDRGVRDATGELLLFSDADVHVAPGALRRAVALVEAERLDHLAVLPQLRPTGFVLDAVLAAFCRVVCLSARPWAVPDPRSRASAGVGAFNLVRRGALERSPGLEHLRLEQADDTALGQMLKRSGARCAIANGRGEVALWFYRTIGELARGMEKAGARWPLPAVAAILTVLLGLELSPWIGLAWGSAWTRAVSAAGALLSLGATIGVARWMRHRVLPAFLAPVGVSLLAWLMLRAGLLALVRGGVLWRGTFYRTEELRAGRRYRLG